MIFRHLVSGFLRKHDCISKGGLKRSSSTYLHEINPHDYQRPGPTSRKYDVVTLDPNKFAEKKQRCFHIGNLPYFAPYSCTAVHNQSSPIIGPRFLYDSGHRLHMPYPPDTKAFLYYFTSPKRSRIAGELRLRVVSGDDPGSFERGSDLLKLNGRLWSRPLYMLPTYYTLLYEKLREELLVPDDLHAVLSTFPPNLHRAQLLYALDDRFTIDFSDRATHLSAITEQGVETILLDGQFAERRHGSTEVMRPYTGIALAQFKRSTLPEHKGTRTVVLRILKIIRSVKCVVPLYDGYIAPPKEGGLHRRSRKAIDKSNPPVWSANIDKSTLLRGLRLLWDT